MCTSSCNIEAGKKKNPYYVYASELASFLYWTKSLWKQLLMNSYSSSRSKTRNPHSPKQDSCRKIRYSTSVLLVTTCSLQPDQILTDIKGGII